MAIDKNGRGGKNIRLISPIKSSANAPADFGRKFAGIFLIRAYAESAGSGKIHGFHSQAMPFRLRAPRGKTP